MATQVFVQVQTSQILELHAWLDAHTPNWYHDMQRSDAKPSLYDSRKHRDKTRNVYENMASARTTVPQNIVLSFDELSDDQLVKLALCWNAKRCKIV